MKRRQRFGLVTTLFLTLFPGYPGGQARGQGIELEQRFPGRQPPPAYYRRIAREPEFFSLGGGWIQRTAQAVQRAAPLSGELRVAVILANFADSPFPPVSAADVQQVLFDGPSLHGTASEYFAEVSGGRLQVTGDVVPWVRTDLTMAEVVGSEWGLGDDARTGEYLLQAVAAADATVDFGQFDNDGPDGIPNSGDDDGQVDAVAVEFQEVAASCGGPSIWPHRSRLRYWVEDAQPFATNDLRPNGLPIVVDDYVTQGATDCMGTGPQQVTTATHELAHVLGLPDLYDRSLGVPAMMRRWVVGCWSLLAAGTWGCGVDDRNAWNTPTHMGAWEKDLLGWLDQVEVVGDVLDREYVLEPVQTSRRILMIPLQPGLPASEGPEYLLAEYRARQGFDRNLPAAGVLLYHIDPKIYGNQVCDSCPQHYMVSLLEADGNDGLRRTIPQGGNRGEAGDAWGVSGPGTLGAYTYPSTRLHSGERSPVTIYRIALEDGTARITLSSYFLPYQSLLKPFLVWEARDLTTEERSYLDRHGNENGRFDVGDLRAYWTR